jgi:hypothetical protein
MRNLLNKLDEKAGKWLDTMDNQLREPIMQSVTGAVFVDGTYDQNDHRKSDKQRASTQDPTYTTDPGCTASSVQLSDFAVS